VPVCTGYADAGPAATSDAIASAPEATTIGRIRPREILMLLSLPFGVAARHSWTYPPETPFRDELTYIETLRWSWSVYKIFAGEIRRDLTLLLD
jgi:hypothetical protein